MDNLVKHDKATCLEQLEKASDSELWKVFLKGQVELFFESEFLLLEKKSWWTNAKNILEIGSGNGDYSSKLSNKSQDKIFLGIEKLPECVEQANIQYANDNLTFQEGDAEIQNMELTESVDVVLFRLTLQHLENPIKALKNASAYLKPSGHVIIIDTYDKSYKSFPSISAIDEALQLAKEKQKSRGYGNRNFMIELLQSLNSKTSDVSNLYELDSSSLDSQGKVAADTIRLQDTQSRLHYFSHALMLLKLFERVFSVPVDLEKAYDELRVYVKDENAWTVPGIQFLVLKKK